jgi:hypothetical protein
VYSLGFLLSASIHLHYLYEAMTLLQLICIQIRINCCTLDCMCVGERGCFYGFPYRINIAIREFVSSVDTYFSRLLDRTESVASREFGLDTMDDYALKWFQRANCNDDDDEGT